MGCGISSLLPGNGDDACGRRRARTKKQQSDGDDGESSTTEDQHRQHEGDVATTAATAPTCLSSPNWIALERGQHATFLLKAAGATGTAAFPYHLYVPEGASATIKLLGADDDSKKTRQQQEQKKKVEGDEKTAIDGPDTKAAATTIVVDKHVWGDGCRVGGDGEEGGFRIDCPSSQYRLQVQVGAAPPPGTLTSDFVSFDPDVFEKVFKL